MGRIIGRTDQRRIKERAPRFIAGQGHGNLIITCCRAAIARAVDAAIGIGSENMIGIARIDHTVATIATGRKLPQFITLKAQAAVVLRATEKDRFFTGVQP